MKLQVLAEFAGTHGGAARYSPRAMQVATARVYDEHIKHLLWLGRVADARAAWQVATKTCGQQPLLERLKRKLSRARVAAWFGMRLRKPE
jgi:hypothetical protein